MLDSIIAKILQQPCGQRGCFRFSIAKLANRPRYGMTWYLPPLFCDKPCITCSATRTSRIRR